MERRELNCQSFSIDSKGNRDNFSKGVTIELSLEGRGLSGGQVRYVCVWLEPSSRGTGMTNHREKKPAFGVWKVVQDEDDFNVK